MMVSNAHTDQHAALLRAVAERLGLAPVKHLIKTPGLTSLLRVTVYYHDRRALDSVATLRHSQREGSELAICYRGAFNQRPIRHAIPQSRFDAFRQALGQLHFDHLHDQPDLPLYGLDFWMIERASGGFIHDVILAPLTAVGDYARLAQAIRNYLPEALRLVPNG